MKKKWKHQEKIGIVMEFVNTNIVVADLCRRHNLSPSISSRWKGAFLEGEQAVALQPGLEIKCTPPEGEGAQKILGRDYLCQRGFKKPWRRAKDDRRGRDGRRHESEQIPALRRAVKNSLVLYQDFGNVGIDHAVSEWIQEIAKQRPTYGTRRMAAQLSREMQQLMSRKKMQRYRKLGQNVLREIK